MKYLILASFILLMVTHNSRAQAPTTISGVINQYVKVTVVDSCSKTLTVPSSAGFSVGDKALIIQMQGATIDESNSANYGTILSINNAGNYEFITISAVTPTSIKFSSKLVRQYTSTGAVQLIRVPQYASVRVQGSPLTASPWNGSTGGVLVFEVSGQVDILGSIDVSGKGFRGGKVNAVSNSEYNISDYFSNYSSNRFGQKGEGIVFAPANKDAARGAQANGGGGGNPHNGGGGGGGNGGMGGIGGAHYNDPSLLYGGSGGRDLNFSTITSPKLFMGGGGGGGHQNEDIGSDGTAGGGIIILQAGSISANGNKIIANGLDQTIQGLNDGQGGGGAGGSVQIDCGQITTPVSISAIGGFGGSIQKPWNYHAPGGGGGGGCISVNNPKHLSSITSNVAAGAAGILLQFNTTWGAEAGKPGIIKSGISIPTGTQNNEIKLVSSDSVVCPGGQVVFRGFSTDSAAIISWKWIFQDGQVVTNATNVTVTKSFPDTGSFRVMLVLQKNGICADTLLSVVKVRANITISTGFAEGCAGSMLKLHPTFLGGTTPYTYKWTPIATNGINGSSTSDSLIVKHDVAGLYSYKLSVQDANGCIASNTFTVNYFEPPAITPMPTTFGCAGENTKLTPSITKGKPPYSFQWIAQNPTSDSLILSGKSTNTLEVATVKDGSYTYKFTVTDANGCQDSAIITYTVVPKPSFVNSAVNPIVSCFEPNRPPTTIGDKITFTGGVPPYTFSWKEAGGGTSTITGSQSTLETQVKPDVTTSYVLTVTDNNPNKKCPFTYTLNVEVRPVPDAPPSTDQIICACDATSIAQLGGEAKCGVQPYSYEWSPTTGLSNPTSNTTARTTARPTQTTTYILKVTDGQSRVAFDTVVVTVVPCPTVENNTLVICDVSKPQKIGVKVSGVPLDGMQYDWSPSVGLDAKNIENPTLTLPDSNATYNYTVNVHDKFGCPATATVTVKTSQTLSITTTSSKPCPQKICRGIDSVMLSAATLGGQPPLEIEWTSSQPVIDFPKKGTSVFARPLETTTFTATVTDANGCRAVSTIDVCVDPVPNVFPGQPDTICTGASITLGKPSTCGEKFVYSWASNPFLVHSDTKKPDAVFTPTTPGTYTLTLTVKDQDGGSQSKSTSGSVTIVARENPKSIFIPAATELCECTVFGNIILARGTRGKAPYSFIWSTNSVEIMREDMVDSSVYFLNTLSKTTTFAVQITDGNGCTSRDSMTVVVNPCPEVTVTSPQICECESVQLSADVVGNPTDFLYKWTNKDGSPAQNFSDTSIRNPVVTPKITSQYKLTVSNKRTGCLTSIFPAIIVGKDVAPKASFIIPSLLSDPRNKKLDIPIVVNEFTANLQCMPREVQFTLSYNENLFDPNPAITQGTVSGVIGSIISNATTVQNGIVLRTIILRCAPIVQLKQGDVLMNISGAALIGDPGFTDLTMSNVEWLCGSTIITPDTSKGLLTLDSLCLLPIGTKRLLTFNKGASVVAMVPNPTTGLSNISLRRFDGEEVKMSVYSALGDELYSTLWQKSDAVGEEIATYPIVVNRGSGVYHIVLRAASGVATEQLVIVK